MMKTKVCEQCPWRLTNQGKRHFGSFYTKKNLKRLWNQIRAGGGMQSCHLTDPTHPDHIKAGAKKDSEPHECPGSLLLVQRELWRMRGDNGIVDGDGVNRYLRERKNGITKKGIFYWLVQRIHMAGIPHVGGRPMLDIPEDEEIGLPAYLREESNNVP